MTATELEQLATRHCQPCSGEVQRYSFSEAQELIELLCGWELSGDGEKIRKTWQTDNFADAIALCDRIAAIAESEGHHPDLHLESYRFVRVELSTHAIGGLSENDFILAAKIDQLPPPRR